MINIINFQFFSIWQNKFNILVMFFIAIFQCTFVFTCSIRKICYWFSRIQVYNVYTLRNKRDFISIPNRSYIGQFINTRNCLRIPEFLSWWINRYGVFYIITSKCCVSFSISYLFLYQVLLFIIFFLQCNILCLTGRFIYHMMGIRNTHSISFSLDLSFTPCIIIINFSFIPYL